MDSARVSTGHRHYGLDWLRIAAFALLIFYHVAMAFSPFHWVINSTHRAHWLAYPLEAVAPWRLMLLFLVSGYASAMLMGKLGSLAAFARSRSRRLLVPLAFAMAVIVPPQSWVRQFVDHGYGHGYLHFWATDYFRFGSLAGETLPHWEHLWFLAYLWLYTLVLAGALAAGLRLRLPDIVLGRVGLLVVPVAILSCIRLGLEATIGTNHGLLDDWLGHAHYLPAFIGGFMLARDPRLWPALRRIAPWSAVVALAGVAIVTTTEYLWPDHGGWSDAQYILYESADSAFAWSMMLLLPVLADRFLNHNHRWRLPLSRAVFPAYIVHQTAIVLLVFALRDAGLTGAQEAAIVLASTIAACVAAWLVARLHPAAGAVLGYEAPRHSTRARLPATA